MITIHTDRLELRSACAGDLAALHAVLSDPRATRFWSTPPHASLDESRAWLDSMIETRPPLGEDFVVEHQGRVIGKAGLYRFPEIGFILHPDYWRRGFAREALEAVVARGFSVHRLPAIVADVDPRNGASLALLARLGFVESGRAAGTWEVGGETCDSIYLKLERPAG